MWWCLVYSSHENMLVLWCDVISHKSEDTFYAVHKVRFSPFTRQFRNLNPASNMMADRIRFLHQFILGAEPSTTKHCAPLTPSTSSGDPPILHVCTFAHTSQELQLSLVGKSNLFLYFVDYKMGEVWVVLLIIQLGRLYIKIKVKQLIITGKKNPRQNLKTL